MNALIISALWGLVMMFIGAFVQSKTLPKTLAVIGAALLFLVNGLELFNGEPFISFNILGMLKMTSGNLTFLQVIFACVLLYFLLSGRDVEKVGEHVGEYFALIFFVLCGVTLSCTYNTLLMLFLGIEIMSIPQYVLAGTDKRNLKGNEASLKYLLLGSFSTGILLLGIAFLYGGNANASFYIDNIVIGSGKLTPMLMAGIVFLITGLSFKVSAAPFHFWTPDVYDGSPTVFTSFMSTIVKVAGFYAFIRLFSISFGYVQTQWQNLILFITIATLLIGNITAIFQQSVKRMLAYSSIAQAGFMLLAVFAINVKAYEGLTLYASAYSLATIGMFAILAKMKDYTVDGFNGLGKNYPVLGFAATVFLLSLTGIPLTAGFQSKFFMLMAAAENGNRIWLIVVAVLFAAISAYYYFRVIQAIYFKEPSGEEQLLYPEEANGWFKFFLLLTAALIIIIGIYPELILGWLYH